MKRFAVLLALLAACRAPELPVVGSVGEHAGVAVDAGKPRPFKTAELAGRVWIVDFVYSSCGGPCPMMTGRLGRLQEELPAEIGLLSVTVDPATDTPARLADYAADAGAAPGRWLFLRLERSALERFLARDMKLAYQVDPSKPAYDRVLHSTRFALVDARGRVRGYYDSGEEAELARLSRDARRLAKGPSAG